MKAPAAVALLAALTVSCAPPLTSLPSGPGAPIGALDAANAYGDAIDACARPGTVSAEVLVSGSAGTRRLRRQLLVGISYDGYISGEASARIEAIASSGPPLFVLVATGGDASLLLPRDSRVLQHAEPRALLDAVTGIPLDPIDLHSVLLGCASEPGEITARAFGSEWIVLNKPQGADTRVLYLHREGTPPMWRIVAEERRSAGQPVWRADYRDFLGGFPRSVRLVSADEGKRFDVTLTLARMAFDVPVGPGAFALQDSGAANPITLDELRHSDPLRQARE